MHVGKDEASEDANSRQLPGANLKQARLVNKQWGAVAASVLWEHLCIDLVDTETRKLSALFHPYCKAIFTNVKQLTITTAWKDVEELEGRHRIYSNLVGLLSILTRDSLTSFESVDLTLDRNLLGLLIQTQSRINDLNFCMTGEDDGGSLPDPAYVRENLRRLKTLCICIAGRCSETYKGYVEWLPRLTMLRRLLIEGVLTKRNEFGGWTLSDNAPLLELRSVELTNLDLLSTASNFHSLLDLPSLEELIYKDYKEAEGMLQGGWL